MTKFIISIFVAIFMIACSSESTSTMPEFEYVEPTVESSADNNMDSPVLPQEFESSSSIVNVSETPICDINDTTDKTCIILFEGFRQLDWDKVYVCHNYYCVALTIGFTQMRYNEGKSFVWEFEYFIEKLTNTLETTAYAYQINIDFTVEDCETYNFCHEFGWQPEN